eukprot:4581243-Pyramimonas_sp.AAC.1
MAWFGLEAKAGWVIHALILGYTQEGPWVRVTSGARLSGGHGGTNRERTGRSYSTAPGDRGTPVAPHQGGHSGE